MRIIIACTLLLVVFGLVMLASASSYLGKERYDDSYYYLKHQLLFGLTAGLAGFGLGFFIPLRWFRRLAVILLLANVVMLALVFTPLGFGTDRADRWLSLGGITFQPSEFLKITYILYIAAWLSGPEHRRKNFLTGFFPFALVSGIVAALLIFQPATSTVVIILASAVAIYFISGARISYILLLGLIGLLALALLVYITPYRKARILNYLNPNANTESGNYQLQQAKNAIESGGLFGVGYGQSTTKIGVLPEPIGDSIFAVIGEELGFVGSVSLVGLFGVLVVEMMLLSRRRQNRFTTLALTGFASVIGLQTFTHIGSNIGLIPLTGVPLPFVSYGGSALVVFLTMAGMAANAGKKGG